MIESREGARWLCPRSPHLPVADEERAAVDDGREALETLCTRLVDVPTPSGLTPRQLAQPRDAPALGRSDASPD
jgi:hypothetical protein